MTWEESCKEGLKDLRGCDYLHNLEILKERLFPYNFDNLRIEIKINYQDCRPNYKKITNNLKNKRKETKWLW